MNSAPDVYETFLEQVRSLPDRTAITDENASLTFAELDELAEAIADRIPEGAGPVGIAMNHGILQIASIFAVLRAGRAFVPVEPDFPLQRIHSMFGLAGVELVLTGPQHTDIAGLVPCLIPQMDWKPDKREAPRHVSPETPAYILFTSGSTGAPKGVIVTNGNLIHYVRAFEHEFHIGPNDVMAQQSVCTFDIFIEEVFCSLLNGAQLAVAPERAQDNTEYLVRFIEDSGVTIVSGFPYLLLELNRLDRIPASLRLLISGGDILRLSYVDKLFDQADVYNTYGPSETTVCASYFRCKPDNALENGTFPVGYPVEGADVLIVDSNGNELGTGEPGEILITGDGVAAGYTEGADSSAFGMRDGAPSFRTGDLGYRLPDGAVAFTRRKDTQVMIHGRRTETGEVENVLCAVDGIEAAHVLAADDDHGAAYLTAYFVSGDPDITVHRIRQELKSFLPKYMIPEFFVQMPSVPLNANGKPDFDAFPIVRKEGTER